MDVTKQNGKPSKAKHKKPSRHHETTDNNSTVSDFQLQGVETWDVTWKILTTTDGWKLENTNDLETGVISTRHFHNIGKIYRLEGFVDASLQEVFEETVLKVNDSPQWNPTVVESKTLQVVDDCTDVSYQVTAAALGGLVSSRDFVSLRHWQSRDGIMLSTGLAVVHPDAPPNKKHVRGHNGPGGWFYKPVADNPNRCIFGWLLNTDIKGWIPQYVVEQATHGMFTDFLNHLRNHMRTLVKSSHTNAVTS